MGTSIHQGRWEKTEGSNDAYATLSDSGSPFLLTSCHTMPCGLVPHIPRFQSQTQDHKQCTPSEMREPVVLTFI